MNEKIPHTTHDTNTQQGLLLPGLDGSNPLGFLAALGTLRIISEKYKANDIKMRWVPAQVTWIPEIFGECINSESTLNEIDITIEKSIELHGIGIINKIGIDDLQERRCIYEKEVNAASINSRNNIDWLAALSSDIASPTSINQLQTARRDYYYGNLSSVIKRTQSGHLHRATAKPWDYADPLDNQSLHIDSSEDRRHAYQWNTPSGDPEKKKYGGMLGANRLAIEAFILFTSLPESGGLRTIGFTGSKSHNTRWTWPVWSTPINIPVINTTALSRSPGALQS